MLCTSLIATVWLALAQVAASPEALRGIVRDSSGAPLAGAVIILVDPAAGRVRATSDDRGRFEVAAPPGDVTLRVIAERFAEARATIAADKRPGPVEIVLAPLGVAATVTVTAGRVEQRLNTLAATVSIVGREALDRSASMTADDALRAVPSFSLFRRSSSLAAHPTAQGVSLRGVGPSGVSRTLLLLDGVPLNDPFGGWMAWSRIPAASIGAIEVVEGSSANLFGNYALGGAINILTRRGPQSSFAGRLQYGERRTPRVEAAGTLARGRLSATLDVAALDTRGYAAVHPDERGLVDENVSAKFGNASGVVRYSFTDGSSVSARAGFFSESRDNGKRSTIDGTAESNRTEWTSASATGRVRLGDSGELLASVFGDRVRLHSNFLAVPAATPARSIGRMTLDQFVPSNSIGAMSQMSRTAGPRHLLSAGVDWRAVEGDSDESGLDPQTGTRTVLHRVSGGSQHSIGGFIQDVFAPAPRVTMTLALRHDRWRNLDGHNLETDAAGTPTANNRPSLPERTDNVTTPRVAIAVRATSTVTAWGSVGWGFRAPTLNELYRQFRVGTVLTLANEALGPERLRSVEAGLRFSPRSDLFLRAAWFDNALEDAVSNVTIATAGTAVTQQRQNLGLTRIRGAQADIDWRPGRMFRVSAAYLYNDAVIREFATNPQLVRKRLAQVPRHRGSLQLSLAAPRFADVAITVQATGRQYDDDLNVRGVPGAATPGLPGYATVDVSVSRSVRRGVWIFASVQNGLDQRVIAGTLPTTLGSPRMASAGVRWNFLQAGR